MTLPKRSLFAVPKDQWGEYEHRFLAKVLKTQDCWIWKGSEVGKGYGQMHILNFRILAHRLSYELYRGQIPPGLTLDHLCRNHSCVNPGHLEPVTYKENTYRGIGVGAKNAAKRFCPKGHPFVEGNLYLRNLEHGERTCLTCLRLKASRNGRLLRAREKIRLGMLALELFA